MDTSTELAPSERSSEAQLPSDMGELRKSLVIAKKELSKCALDNSWAFTIPAVAVAVPLSVRYKTYSPLVFAAVSASGADYYRGLKQCESYANNMKSIQRLIAEIEHGIRK